MKIMHAIERGRLFFIFQCGAEEGVEVFGEGHALGEGFVLKFILLG